MISVITPIYDIEKHLHNYAVNMRSLQKEFNGIREIILINNNPYEEICKDSVLSGLNGLKIIGNRKNLGYGGACNQGISIAKGKYMLILNPDVKITGHSLRKLISELIKSKEANIISCKLLNEDGSLQHSCRRFPTIKSLLARRAPLFFSRIFSKELSAYNMDDYDHKNPIKVDWVSGALMLMKRKYFFDERYFMYFEDVDLCRRVGEIYYYPFISAFHKAERGSARDITLMIAHFSSALRYFLKFGLKKY